MNLQNSRLALNGELKTYFSMSLTKTARFHLSAIAFTYGPLLGAHFLFYFLSCKAKCGACGSNSGYATVQRIPLYCLHDEDFGANQQVNRKKKITDPIRRSTNPPNLFKKNQKNVHLLHSRPPPFAGDYPTKSQKLHITDARWNALGKNNNYTLKILPETPINNQYTENAGWNPPLPKNIYIYILGKKVKKILLYMLRLLTMAAQNVSGMNKIVFVDTINDGIDQSGKLWHCNQWSILHKMHNVF